MVGAVVLAACGGGAETTENPVTDAPSGGPSYNGPPAATGDIQAFQVSLWSHISLPDRCGNCHGANGQPPTFARTDDVNLAYRAAQSIVDLADPAQSRMVTKVAGGHNCWRADTQACAADLTKWISDWAAFSQTGGGRAIQLTAPIEKDPGESKRFPAVGSDEYAAVRSAYEGVHSLLRQHCSDCHTPDAAAPQSPFFAVANVDDSYEAAKSKMNLDDPAKSRLVVRLSPEFHNCWSDCESDANRMLQRIQAVANAIAPTQVDRSLVLSKALTLFDGVVAAGGNRYDNHVIALYEFKTMQGTVAFDTSGVEPALDLNLSPGVTWVGGWGINIPRGSKAQGLTSTSRKLKDRISLTGEYSIEAWVIPGNVVQENASIVSYSGGVNSRNFALGQTKYNYEFFARSSATNASGGPALSTADADKDLQAALQHVVVTFSPVNGRRIYVNGEDTGVVDRQGGGTISSWDDSFALVIGNDAANNRPWTGTVRMLAIHDRALTPAQIKQNFEVGVGQKYFLLFGISHLVDVPQAYILFEAAEYDSYSYLFTNPRFISLDANARPGSIRIKGMRIGINGAEPSVGQAYRTLDTLITDSGYTPEAGFSLSTVGTIIGREQGPESDEFFLCFDQLGTRSSVCSTYPTPMAPVFTPGTPPSDIGVRTFDEINATMAKITGVSPNTPAVKSTYESIRQSLPATSDIEAFLSSHQTSIAQLAIQYCDALVKDGNARTRMFGTLPSSLTSANASSVVNPLVAAALGASPPATQPDPDDVRTELTNLVGRLCPGGCTGSRLAVAVAATCGAVLGSAVTLVK